MAKIILKINTKKLLISLTELGQGHPHPSALDVCESLVLPPAQADRSWSHCWAWWSTPPWSSPGAGIGVTVKYMLTSKYNSLIKTNQSCSFLTGWKDTVCRSFAWSWRRMDEVWEDVSHLDRYLVELLRKLVVVLRRTCHLLSKHRLPSQAISLYSGFWRLSLLFSFLMF